MRRFLAAVLLMIASATTGQDTNRESAAITLTPAKTGWVMTGSFPAPEAHQAAAADEKHFYVINNTTVAAYDRITLERQWVSHGGNAMHLNSGFVWQGRLFCAHSNYPRQPNTSQIKVVELTSGEMSDFKDFGITDGSLTWAVRHDEAWWCNFAYYGDDHQQTRLVRYDDDWQESGSWTYPEQIFAFLGRHSLSGGIWHADTLLVTDHDNPILYRLRLPKSGSVLQWVDRRIAPFTGQGFAIDPLGGALGDSNRDSAAQPSARGPQSDSSAAPKADFDISLIGINRAKRLVILASPAE